MKENYNSLGEAPRVLSSGSGSVQNSRNEISTQQNTIKPTCFFNVILLLALFTSVFSNAQVTTNSGSGLAPTYTSLANAVTALNAATITSPVIITLTGNETAPAGGYRITASGGATNTIIIQGVTSTITTNAGLTVGSLNDAIFKLVGADFVTIRNFTMQENAANTVATPAASNNMTEWGVALLYLTATNGAQNNTIEGNTISLNKTYRNSFGIYSNSTHTEASVTASATATGASGSNTGLSIFSNNISNVNLGIAVVGPTAAADHNLTLTIGGAGLGNSITNFSTDVQLTSYANVSGTPYGVLVRNTCNFTISYNTITSSNGGYIGAVGSFRGIYVIAFSNPPTGTLTRVIDHNTISLRPGVAAPVITGISVENGSGNSTTSLSVSNNDFNNTAHTVPGTGSILFINVNSGNLVANINSNTFTNLSVDTTGVVQFIAYNIARPANAVTNVNNNSIVGTFNKAGNGGSIAFYFSSAAGSPTSATETNTGNNFSNVIFTGTGNLSGWQCSDGASTSPFGPSKTVTNNTFNNITGGTGNMVVLQVYGSNHNTTNMVANNTVSNITGGGPILGIGCRFWGSQRVENNTVFGLTGSGIGIVAGIEVTSTATGSTQSVIKNKVYNLENNNATGSVYGIRASNAETINVQNNIIGDLRMPNANVDNQLRGIDIGTTTGTVNVSHNTVLLNAISSGGLFGSSALYANSATALTLKNNILVNNSTANGAGFSAALRYSSTDLSNYNATSNNNLFYGSTIFTDGTNTDTTLAAFKTRVAPRDACSVTENPTFVSTVGTNANFLHIDTTVPTLIESWGTAIAGVTDDFDGDARNVTTPDIGADEFNGTFIPPTTNSTTISACDNYTWSVNGVNYTASGIYNYSADCHHIETLDLRINKVWNGSVSTDWNDPSNWTPAGVPASTDCVVIPDTANEPVIGGTNYSALGQKLTVNADTSLNITATNTLEITNVINVNATGTLIVHDDASIVQTNNVTNVGNIQYKRTANIRKLDYVFWSSPVSGFASSAISPGTDLGYQFKWTPTIGTNTNGFGNWEYANETMVQGKGYIVRAPDAYSNSTLTDYTATFVGVPNNGDISIPISRGTWNGGTYSTGTSATLGTDEDDNWNLVGNPYPSAIHAIDFLTLNTNIDGFVNIWTHGTLPSNATTDPFYDDYAYNYTPTDFITYNSLGASSGAGTFNGRIAGGQGFFVSMLHASASDTENLNFNNSLRSNTYNNAEFYRNASENKSSDEFEKHRIWFDLVTSSGSSVRSLLGYAENATDQEDRLFDAFSNEKQSFNIFSLIEDKPMLIQGRKLPFDENDKVNIGVSIPQDGLYKIALSSVDGLFLNPDQNIYLEDKLLNVIFNLKDAPYSFMAIKGNILDRFIIRYNKNGNVSEVSNLLHVYDNSQLTVESGKLKIKDIVIFDSLGKLLLNKTNLDNKYYQITNLNKTNSVLIVKVTLEDSTQEIRKIAY